MLQVLWAKEACKISRPVVGNNHHTTSTNTYGPFQYQKDPQEVVKKESEWANDKLVLKALALT
jgi:hypothetical protein